MLQSGARAGWRGSHDQGATYGAAFSNSREGWPGTTGCPCISRPARSESARTVAVSFRHALVAVARSREPRSRRCPRSSGRGRSWRGGRLQARSRWLPKACLAQGTRNTALRAVAWPTPDRPMRSVTQASTRMKPRCGSGEGNGLWNRTRRHRTTSEEPARDRLRSGKPRRRVRRGRGRRAARLRQDLDPAGLAGGSACTPESEASNSAYAEESERCGSWANASFTSVAFAGAEAIVAYRILPDHTTERYQGGLIVNDGSGWHIDQSAHEAMGSNVPWAVSGLRMAARRSAPRAWSTSAKRQPAVARDWRLRSGGLEQARSRIPRKRLDACHRHGSVPNTTRSKRNPKPRPARRRRRSPPTRSGESRSGVVRQTATGWSDQEHELNDAAEPKATGPSTTRSTSPTRSRPCWELFGSQGCGRWVVETEQHGGVLDTADVDRYGEPGVAPLGKHLAGEPANPSHALFAIGATRSVPPCATRARARWTGRMARRSPPAR